MSFLMLLLVTLFFPQRSKEANDAMQRLQSSEQELRDAKERLKEANDAMQRLQSSEQELRDAKERSEHENTRLRREAEWVSMLIKI